MVPVSPNDVAALSNLVAIPVVWSAAESGGLLWGGCLLLAASASLAYHAAETTGQGHGLEGAWWASSLRQNDELLLAVDRACAALAIAATIAAFCSSAGIRGDVSKVVRVLIGVPGWLLLGAVGVAALLATTFGGLSQWPYAVLHSVWHLSAMACAGVAVQLRDPDAPTRAADALVVGLGNPGLKYEGSRHNVGFQVVDLLAARATLQLQPGPHKARAALLSRAGQTVLLARPETFMNASGRAVAALCEAHGICDGGKVIVVHDELDLPPGRMKLKLGGGEAGHNGLRSIVSCIGTTDFVRVRIGVGKPPKGQGPDFVLGRPEAETARQLAASVERAAEAVEAILDVGLEMAMSSFNGKAVT